MNRVHDISLELFDQCHRFTRGGRVLDRRQHLLEPASVQLLLQLK